MNRSIAIGGNAKWFAIAIGGELAIERWPLILGRMDGQDAIGGWEEGHAIAIGKGLRLRADHRSDGEINGGEHNRRGSAIGGGLSDQHEKMDGQD